MPVLDECRVGTTESEDFVYVDLNEQYDFELEPANVKEFSCRMTSSLKTINHPKQIPASKISKNKPIPINDTIRMAASSVELASSPTGSDSNNICYVHSSEAYPKKEVELENPSLEVPFIPICGEYAQYVGETKDGILAISNYRIYHKSSNGIITNIPLMVVEIAEIRDLFYLHILCKDARSLKCTFTTGEKCLEWQKRIMTVIQPPDSLHKYFAFSCKAWSSTEGGEEVSRRLNAFSLPDRDTNFNKEFARLEFNETWRISNSNVDFNLCSSYPPKLIVPLDVTDETLEIVAKFRSARRIPAVVWRHKGNGAVIVRCSQPEVGWLGWRSNEDEYLLAALAASSRQSKDSKTPPRKLLIIDARSYASAVTNRARGGGYECSQYYPGAEIKFMNLPNIHSVRKSFQALRALVAEPPEHANWHSVLEKSLWLQAVGGLLKAATDVARSVHIDERPTLVHCSDGWDRTPQIVSTAELLLDPYYRTCEGFQILVEREWLDFGHKFADRCGHTVGTEDLNERCPVFLQWLDCVHQLVLQYPCSFEFSQAYLIKLAQHAYSCLFGTFLCNSLKERKCGLVEERTFSVWNFLRGPAYLNHLYEPNKEVLYPAHSARALVVWAAVYLGVAPDMPAAAQPPSSPPPPAHSTSFNGSHTNGLTIFKTSTMTKTRSYQDLSTLNEYTNATFRRSSDPNIAIDPMKRSTLSLSETVCNNSNASNKNMGQSFIHSLSNDDISSDRTIKDSKSSLGRSMDGLRDLSISDINTTIPKQIVKGYSPKENGNIVPTNSTYNKIDLSKMIDSNYNTKISPVGMSESSCELYENGNILYNKRQPDLFDQTDGFIDKQVLNISGSFEEPMSFPIDDEPDVKIAHMSVSPTNDSLASGPISSEHDRIGRPRYSESEWSQNTDSSCVDLANDINLDSSLKDRHFDPVQNGVLDDTNANLLATEVGRTFEALKKQSSECKVGSLDDDFQHCSPPAENSEMMTLCPNSPHKPNQRVTAPSRNLSSVMTRNENNWHGNDTWTELCYLNKLHHNDSHGCNATHLQCLLHCYTHCTHSIEAPGNNNLSSMSTLLDPVDGLVFPQSPVQHRLHQIIQGHKMKEEALRKELHAARVELQQRAARVYKSNSENLSRNSLQESFTNESVESAKRFSFDDNSNSMSSSNNYPENYTFDSSVGNSEEGISRSNSGTYHRSSGSFSSRSGHNSDTTLWVPDHVVSSCTRCGAEFWLGKRKHHCRHCGKIFCAGCSEKSIAIPKEQLYNPVRVCLECHEELTSESRILFSEQSSSRPSEFGTKMRSNPVTSSTHSSSAEVRPLSDYCKQASGDQKLNSSPVTAASN